MSTKKDSETESRVDSECLLLEISGKTWYVPFDTLEWVPRVGESVHVAGGSGGKVAEVEYEFTPEAPPSEWEERKCPVAGHTRDHCESWSKCRELLSAFPLSPNMRPLQNEVDLRASVKAYFT